VPSTSPNISSTDAHYGTAPPLLGSARDIPSLTLMHTQTSESGVHEAKKPEGRRMISDAVLVAATSHLLSGVPGSSVHCWGPHHSLQVSFWW
jgi:hypothetical protein